MMALINSLAGPKVKTNVRRVIIIAGQSNAGGFGTGAPAEPYLNAPIVGCRIWTGANWATLEYNVNNQPWGPGAHGPELNLGYLFAQVSILVYIIKWPVGGSDLFTEWAAGSVNYLNLVARANAALANLNGFGISYIMAGFVWNQGEKDALIEAKANAYDANLKDLYDRLQVDIEPMPFVCARTHINTIARPFLATVRTAQEAITVRNRATWINVDDGALQGDDLHYDSALQNTSGERFYDELKFY